MCIRPFRTHVQGGREEDYAQVLFASRADFGLQAGTPRQGRMHQQPGDDNIVGRFTPTFAGAIKM